jgi:Mn2+/Fe2+ NRAMP family transporter
MAFSNIVAYFIILAAAATLHTHGIVDVETSSQAAEALRPIAGKSAFILFGLGIIGTGLLAVPVLAGSAAYAVGEALQWPTGMDRKPLAAKGFYSVLILSTLLGLAINFPEVQHFTHVTPVRALFWAAVLNGVAAVPIMVILMHMIRNEKIMHHFRRVSRPLQVMGWLATAVMAVAAVLMFATF